MANQDESDSKDSFSCENIKTADIPSTNYWRMPGSYPSDETGRSSRTDEDDEGWATSDSHDGHHNTSLSGAQVSDSICQSLGKDIAEIMRMQVHNSQIPERSSKKSPPSQENWEGSDIPTAAMIAAWTSAFYNTLQTTARNYQYFDFYQEMHIETKELLLALKHAAACHAEEQGEYNLAVYKAKRLGMTAGVHFQPIQSRVAGPLDVGELERWKRLAYAEQRLHLCDVVADLRAWRTTRVNIITAIERTEARWKELSHEDDGQRANEKRFAAAKHAGGSCKLF